MEIEDVRSPSKGGLDARANITPLPQIHGGENTEAILTLQSLTHQNICQKIHFFFGTEMFIKPFNKISLKKFAISFCLWDIFCIAFDTLGIFGNFLLTTMLILDTKQIMQITFWKYRTFQAVSLIVFFIHTTFHSPFLSLCRRDTNSFRPRSGKDALYTFTGGVWEVIAGAVLVK